MKVLNIICKKKGVLNIYYLWCILHVLLVILKIQESMTDLYSHLVGVIIVASRYFIIGVIFVFRLCVCMRADIS